jgi:hypothetical protein
MTSLDPAVEALKVCNQPRIPETSPAYSWVRHTVNVFPCDDWYQKLSEKLDAEALVRELEAPRMH